MSMHLDLATRIEEHFGEHLERAVELKLDALIAHFSNGVSLEARIADPHAYAITWSWGEAELRIDTAPLHRDLATFPNHLHGADGSLHHDPLTLPGVAPWDNLQRIIVAILADPLLDRLTTSAGARPT
ncbi:hypothetical protein [Zoogloea sp.]|uniref:hypothetical protein n=1 Tax=Zoogloea sp. TaxID=49181 RepID=UPI001AD0FB9C|nr:hypothetical protein [Zoogloea sp.]MBN8282669.1 hypothetical protein [Zoogloea sp.]